MIGVPVVCVLVLAFMCHSHSLEMQNPIYRFKRSQENVLSDTSNCMSRIKQQRVLTKTDNFSVDIRMPGVVPTGSDTYLCMAFPVPTNRDTYIVDFIPHASMETVHHMLLFGCQTPVSTRSYWDCGSVQGTCEDEASIMYAWARNAPPTKLPKDVGFKVGRNSGMSYFVLQIHYGEISAFRDHHRDCSGITLRMTSKPQPFIAGIYLLMSVDTVILPGKRDFHLERVLAWPQSSLQLGQVSGLALDTNSNLVIFHRGDHHWGEDSFNSQARYQQRSLGPIQQSTILVVDPAKGNILKASGRNMFYLPHGITIDKENNYWVTDVALHQVLKVSSDGRDRTLLALGEAFTPGSDITHFCQPTDVAVDTGTGNIFVSDGYCNARILKFSPDGKYLSQWGAGSSDRRRRIPFQIPHSLVFLPERQEVCVADRENGRIQCFITETGEFVKEIKKEEFGGKVFAITFSPAGGGLIFAVNGASAYRSVPLSGFVINYSTKEILDTFSPEKKEFKMPHDIVATRDGSVFVGDAGSKSVFKFTTEKSHRSVKKAGIEVQELEEMEMIIQTKERPEHNLTKMGAIQEMQKVVQQPRPQEEAEKENHKSAKKANREQGILPAIITTLLLIPLLVVISMGVFICWRNNNRCEVKTEPSSVGGILGKIRGKAVGSLNLGNFFASHKGYSRQGFDQLSTEDSDQERNDEDSSDSENEEYSAVPPPQSSS
ncbi:peptidyl-glycine alpha-amidating monooxygenase A isoform X2 [Larimichthys crocea]|uniref:peptidyl-glycine alpha-amidating monooxygenase A isoform X2 n=1 Tax=Larimichthys crocea TaxID=215358 RepID=UPI000F5F1C4F|nr:peptidyl-glycine alpha-amidating monooxygenase isoform X2 [Larimichthys crocea]